jgi:cyclomaltodextrinase
MQKLKPVTIQLGNYRHFKGNLYEVIDVAHHSETQEAMVVYRALYGDRGLWVRPLQMFLESIQREGKKIKLFQYIGEESS